MENPYQLITRTLHCFSNAYRKDLNMHYFTIDSAGIIRGSGQQKIAAYVNLGAYYVMGIPTAIVLAFVFHIGGKVRDTKSLYFHNLIFPAYFFLNPSGTEYNTSRVILLQSNIYECSLQGLWMGIIVALFVQALSLAIIILLTDWEKEVNYFFKLCFFDKSLLQ